MKKKLLIGILAILIGLCALFAFVACGEISGGNGNQNSTEQGGDEQGKTDPPTTIEVTEILLNKTSLSLYEGDSKTLTATISPANASDQSVTWKSSNPAVATVTDGTISALQKGNTIITATAGAKSATCSVTVKERSTELLTFATLTLGNDDTAYGKVSNDTASFSFLKEITASSETTYTVCKDLACTQTIPSKTVSLDVGDNTFYLLVERENDLTLFTVTIRRRPIYTITFNTNGGTSVPSQQIEEDKTITEQTTEKIGYTFAGWTLNNENAAFPYTVIENTTFTAAYAANTYTATLDVNGGDEFAKTEYSAIYDSLFTFLTPTRTGYSFLGWYDGETTVSDCDWKYTENKTFTAKWQINTYQVSLDTTSLKAGTVSGAGEYDYEESVTLSATTFLGYSWCGWYNSNDELITDDLIYTFDMPAEILTYSAKWELREDIVGFDFTSTETSLTIMGIKDKTVATIFVPSYVTTISEGAFSGCGSLTSITIPFVGGVSKGSNRHQSISFRLYFRYKQLYGWNRYTSVLLRQQYE